MVTQKRLEAWNVQVELDIWKGRRSIYGGRRNALKSAYVLKNDAVVRRERSLLKHFFHERFEEKLEKEKWEANLAKEAYEKVEFYVEEGNRRIPELEQKMAEEICMNLVQSGSSDPKNEIERSLIEWCDLVEEEVSIADSVTSFLKDLLVCIQRSNDAKAEGDETSDIQVRVCEIVEKTNIFFEKVEQKYGKLEKWKNINQIPAKQMVLLDKSKNMQLIYIDYKTYVMQNGMVRMKENALLYTIQDEMQNLQQILVETFAVMEEDGERLLGKLKRECRDTDNLGLPEKNKTVSYELKKVLPIYPNKELCTECNSVLVQAEFCEGDNLQHEREVLLNGLSLLNAELKSAQEEVKKIFERSHNRFFGKLKKELNEEKQVPEGIKTLEENIEAWCKSLKRYKRRAGNFSCALDEFASIEILRMNRSLESNEAVSKQSLYFTYLVQLENMLKTTEKQLADFFKGTD